MPLLLLIAGCWDERQLKDAQIVFATSLDVPRKGWVEAAMEFPEAGTEMAPPKTKTVLSGSGHTIEQSMEKIDNKRSGRVTLSKMRVLLIGEETAGKDMYPILDQFYRDPSSPLNAKIVVTEGKAASYLQYDIEGEQLLGQYYRELIESGEEKSVIPNMNLQLFFSPLLDKGIDPVLPLIGYVEEKKVAAVKGSALFHERKMTGTLSTYETSALLMMRNEKRHNLHLLIPLGDSTYITVTVDKAKTKTSVDVSQGQKVKAEIKTEIQARILESTLTSPEDYGKMSEKAEEEVTKLMDRTIRKIQEANCDALGIGRKIIARDPSLFKEMNWSQVYPEAEVSVETNVEITENGVIL